METIDLNQLAIAEGGINLRPAGTLERDGSNCTYVGTKKRNRCHATCFDRTNVTSAR